MIDVRGLSCPEPVIILRKLMLTKEESYELVTDNMTCVENLTRYAEHEGYNVNVTKVEDDYKVEIVR